MSVKEEAHLIKPLSTLVEVVAAVALISTAKVAWVLISVGEAEPETVAARLAIVAALLVVKSGMALLANQKR